jgi:hypothetical protein
MRDSSDVGGRGRFLDQPGSLDRGPAPVWSVSALPPATCSHPGRPAGTGTVVRPAEDDPTITETPAVLSDALWRGRFGADPATLGRTIHVDARTYTVVGVAPRDFHGPQSRRVDLWVPLRAVAADFVGKDWESTRNMYWMRMLALRKAGVSPALARERASDVHHRANRAAQEGDSLTTRFRVLVPARGQHRARTRGGIQEQAGWAVVPGAGGHVLTGGRHRASIVREPGKLLPSRASRRRREIAVRIAMGRARPARATAPDRDRAAVLVGGGPPSCSPTGPAHAQHAVIERGWTLHPSTRVRVHLGSALRRRRGRPGASLVASRQDSRAPQERDARRRTSHPPPAHAPGGAGRACGAPGRRRPVRAFAPERGSLRLGYDADNVLVANIDVTSSRRRAPSSTSSAGGGGPRAPASRRGIAIRRHDTLRPSWATDFFIPGRDSPSELGRRPIRERRTRSSGDDGHARGPARVRAHRRQGRRTVAVVSQFMAERSGRARAPKVIGRGRYVALHLCGWRSRTPIATTSRNIGGSPY